MFASNVIEGLSELERSKIVALFYGHTHTEMINEILNVKTYCNPLGYPGERHNVNYQASVEV